MQLILTSEINGILSPILPLIANAEFWIFTFERDSWLDCFRNLKVPLLTGTVKFPDLFWEQFPAQPKLQQCCGRLNPGFSFPAKPPLSSRLGNCGSSCFLLRLISNSQGTEKSHSTYPSPWDAQDDWTTPGMGNNITEGLSPLCWVQTRLQTRVEIPKAD